MAQLDEFISIAEEAIEALPTEHPERDKLLDSLSFCQSLKPAQKGTMIYQDDEISLAERAIDTLPLQCADRGRLFNNLGYRLELKYKQTGLIADLDSAIRIAEKTVNSTSSFQHPFHIGSLNQLLNRLLKAWSRAKAMDYLEKIIETARKVLEAPSIDQSDKFRTLKILGENLAVKFTINLKVADLQEATVVMQQAADTASSVSDRADCLTYLASFSESMFLQTGDVQSLEKAILVHRESIDLTPSSDLGLRADRLYCLGKAARDHSLAVGDKAGLEDAVEILEQAVDFTPSDLHDTRADRFTEVAVLLRDRFKREGKNEDLEKAIFMFQKALDASSSNEGGIRADRLFDLSLLLHYKFLRVGEEEYLYQAIRICNETIAAIPSSQVDKKAEQLAYLSSLLGDKFTRTADIADLEQAIRLSKEARETPMANEEIAMNIRAGLITLLNYQFWQTGDCSKLDEAISISLSMEEKLSARSEPGPLAHCMHDLSVLFSDRYVHTGDMASLERAIETGQRATKMWPCGSPDRYRPFYSLAHSLSKRFQRTRELPDIQEALGLLQEALEMTSSGAAIHAQIMHEMSRCLSIKFDHTGALADLTEAIRVSRAVVKVTPFKHIDRAARLSNLGSYLLNRYARSSSISDIEEAIQVSQQAVEALPFDSVNKPLLLSNLGNCINTLYLHSGKVQDLEASIATHKNAVDTAPPGLEERGNFLFKLSMSIGQKYLRDGSSETAQEAMSIAKQAINETPSDHPSQATYFQTLATLLRARYSNGISVTKAHSMCREGCSNELEEALTGPVQDIIEAKKYLLLAFKHPTAPTRARILASRDLLSLPEILDNLEEAYQISEEAVNLIPLLTPRSFENTDKRHLLSAAVGISSNAAAIAISAGKDPICAVRLLETGRGIILNTLFDRSEQSSLEKEHPRLAESFHRLREQLDEMPSSNTSSILSANDRAPKSEPVDHEAIKSQVNSILQEIRALPKFERFLITATESEICQAASLGVIVIVNISCHRCDALIIETTGIQSMRLERLSQEELQKRSNDLHSLDTLGWLWDTIVNPVLNKLGFKQTPIDHQWRRIRWVPTGILIRFPLHAAGFHLQRNSATALDRVISTYSSSIKGIIRYQSQKIQIMPPKGQGSAVIIGMQSTNGHSSLKFAQDEANQITSICRLMGQTPISPKACKEDVLSALKTCSIFHFAGHASTNEHEPLNGTLLLEDWQDSPLTVGTLLETDFVTNQPFLAYLSACGTSQILDDGSVDEYVHLASACQLAGFRHVIGTLWSVDDEFSVEMARMVYKFLLKNGLTDDSVDQALHNAIRTLRDRWIGGSVERKALEIELAKLRLTGARDIELEEPEPEPDCSQAHWVPYIHYC
ncbi:CHAT domain-containing protein [Penicillium herquei]|nr:CHAT domain-containing protein [Penicillium herquei]